jgi:hypothetical protein
METMSLTRIATYSGAVLLAAFVLIVLAYGQYGAGSGLIVVIALVLLIAAGSKLYGRGSRYGTIAARKRPAQEAHNRAADLAAEARQATAEAARRGERYCPLDRADLAHHPDHAAHAATNGHASAAHPAPQTPPPPAPQQPT